MSLGGLFRVPPSLRQKRNEMSNFFQSCAKCDPELISKNSFARELLSRGPFDDRDEDRLQEEGEAAAMSSNTSVNPRELSTIVSQTRAALDAPTARMIRLKTIREEALLRKEVSRCHRDLVRKAEVEERTTALLRQQRGNSASIRQNATEEKPVAEGPWLLRNRDRDAEKLDGILKAELLPSATSLKDSEKLLQLGKAHESYVKSLPNSLNDREASNDIFRRWRIEETRLQLQTIRRTHRENIGESSSRSISSMYNEIAVRQANEDILRDVDSLSVKDQLSAISPSSLDAIPNTITHSALELAVQGSGAKYVATVRERIEKAANRCSSVIIELRKQEAAEVSEHAHRSSFVDTERRRMLAILQSQRKTIGKSETQSSPAFRDTREDIVVQRMLEGNLVKQNFSEHPIDAYQRKVREDLLKDREQDFCLRTATEGAKRSFLEIADL